MDLPPDTQDAIGRIVDDLKAMQSSHDSRLLASILLVRAAAIFSTLTALGLVTREQTIAHFQAATTCALSPPVQGVEHTPVYYGSVEASTRRQ